MSRSPLNRLPLASHLENCVRERLAKRRFGLRLPTEKELAEEFKVSIPTLHKALLNLEKAKLIEQADGRGWKISPHGKESRVAILYDLDISAPEIAYGVRAKFAGKGYAFEGAVAACDFAVEFLKWPELMHSIAPDNIRSQALAKRLGATNSGPTRLPAPFEQTRVDAWTQSAEAWRIKRKEFQP